MVCAFSYQELNTLVVIYFSINGVEADALLSNVLLVALEEGNSETRCFENARVPLTNCKSQAHFCLMNLSDEGWNYLIVLLKVRFVRVLIPIGRCI